MERTAAHVQVMWTINRLTGRRFKTIADFRRTRGAIGTVCRAFIGFCREQSLFGAELFGD